MDEHYRQLAFAVIYQSVKDYRQVMCNTGNEVQAIKCLKDVDVFWFLVVDMNKDWFIERFLKSEKERKIKHELKKRFNGSRLS